MEHSSGIIVYRKNGDTTEFFVCTPDGPFWKNRELWNFPKGHIEKNETPFEAALREFEEETGVPLTNDINFYKYIGEIKQNTSKKVHVFIKKYDNEDFSNCSSNLCSSVINGVEIIHPEIKSYKWMTLNEILEKGIKCYYNIFKNIANDKNY